LLEVYPRNKATFSIETIPAIGVGKTSRPIRILASNAPHTAVNIDIALANNDITGITIQPSTLNFSSGRTERYFLISVDADF
jgi:hypothetical protein